MRKTARPVVWKAHGAQSPWAQSDRGKDSKIILAAFHFLPFTRTLSLSPYPVMHDIDVDKVIDSVQSLKKDLTEDSDDIKLSES
jgi:hypothetical protein